MPAALSDYLESLSKQKSQAELISVLEEKIADLGYDRIAFADITSGRHNKPETPAFILSYPMDWVEHYFDNGYQDVDPATRFARIAGRAFRWDEVPAAQKLSRKQKLVLEEAKSAGLHNGASVPLYGPGGGVAVVAMARSNNSREQVALPTLAAICAIFHANYASLGETPPPDLKLAPRERECLHWVAQGKSSWDIGTILNISEHSVHSYIRSALVKLGASSRVAGVVKAMRLGLITP